MSDIVVCICGTVLTHRGVAPMHNCGVIAGDVPEPRPEPAPRCRCGHAAGSHDWGLHYCKGSRACECLRFDPVTAA